MKFAVSLVRLLCGLVAGVLLVAYLYFTINYEQTGVAGSHTLALACLFLFTAALLIWGGLAIMGDVWLKRIDNKEFYQKLLRESGNGSIAADLISAENTQQFSNLLNQINAANEDSKQTLLSGFRDLNEKLAAWRGDENTSEGRSLIDEVRTVSQNMTDVQAQIETLLAQLQQQKKILSQLTDYPSKLNNGETKFYPVLQEEADYPESVIDYSEQQPNNDVVSEDIKTSAENNEIIDQPVKTDEEAIDTFMDEPIENLLNEKNDFPVDDIDLLPDDTTSDVTEIDLGTNTIDDLTTSNDASINIEAEDTFDVDDVTLDLTDNIPEFTSVLTDEQNIDLGADNPFGTDNSAFGAPEAEINFEPEQNIDFGADNPFGTEVDSEIDINAVEPAVNTKKNEPNLEQIFNDELASELADLEILNDKPTQKKQDDIDLEQFFASHRKSIDG